MDNYTIMKKESYMKDECLICFYDIDIECTYVKCHTCKKKFHEHCMNTWKDMQNKTFSVCVHCSENNLQLHKTVISCCCWLPVFKRKQTRIKKDVIVYK
jgi:hypothetical protein